MAAAYTAAVTGLVLQSGMDVETSPEGMTTLTLKYRCKSADVVSLAQAIVRGDACPVSGYTALDCVATPRFTTEGAFSTVYVVYQGLVSGSETPEASTDISYTSEARTIQLVTSADAANNTYDVSYVAPTVTAHYVALAKPGSFRFETSVDSEGDPTIISAKPVAPSPAIDLTIDEHYLAEKESKWLERRQSGGIWQCSEQHSTVIVNKSAF